VLKHAIIRKDHCRHRYEIRLLMKIMCWVKENKMQTAWVI